MSTQPIDDLRDFHRFVGDKVSNGDASLSPEDVLDEWRALHPRADELADDVAAIRGAIDNLENGDEGIPSRTSIGTSRHAMGCHRGHDRSRLSNPDHHHYPRLIKFRVLASPEIRHKLLATWAYAYGAAAPSARSRGSKLMFPNDLRS